MSVNPLLLDFPASFDTERLTIRAPRPGDGAALHAAILASLPELKPWMPWVHPVPTVADTEANVRKAVAQFVSREDLRLHLYLRGADALIGSSGLHRIDWTVPRFEIGYWVGTPCAGRGYITEAVTGITAFARDHLGARRVEIRMDERNEPSWRVAERAGFTLEAVLRQEHRSPDGTLGDQRIYAKIF
jgi:RimJ/RimL family protein N-acetyltransferase